MAHIAIVTGLLTGRINSSFEMASRLQNEGHTITYLCQPQSQKRIEENNFLCFPVSEITFDYVDHRRPTMASWFTKFKFHFKNLNSHFAQGKKILKLEEHKEVLRKVNPDLVLIDTEIHDFIFTALELKIPVKLMTTWFSDTISSRSPSIRTDVIPGQDFNGTKIGICLSWFIMRMKINGRVLINRLAFENYRRWMFKKYAQEFGFDTNGLLLNTLPPLYSFTKLPILLMTMSELEFPHKLAKNLTYVGPMVYQNRKIDNNNSKDHERLRAILELKEVQHKNLVYCAVGSLAKGHLPFLKKVIEAVADLDTVILILSIGPKMSLASFESIPENVHIFNWVPQLEVLSKSDCAIVSCGVNTINECIHNKVPMLLYSTGYTDQNGNAAKIAYHGLGIRGDIFKENALDIRSNISKILEDEGITDNIKRFNSLYQEYQKKELSQILFREISK